MTPLTIDGVEIADTFAEAFPMTAARAIVTADSAHWAEVAGDPSVRQWYWFGTMYRRENLWLAAKPPDRSTTER